MIQSSRSWDQSSRFWELKKRQFTVLFRLFIKWDGSSISQVRMLSLFTEVQNKKNRTFSVFQLYLRPPCSHHSLHRQFTFSLIGISQKINCYSLQRLFLQSSINLLFCLLYIKKKKTHFNWFFKSCLRN